MKSVAARARSTGGRAGRGTLKGVMDTGDTLDDFGMGLASRGGVYRRHAGGAIASTGRAISKYPRSSMGIAAGGIGYGVHRGLRGSQNNPIQGLE